MQLTLKDYLDSATEASRRVRSTTIVLVVITVLVLAGVLNTLHHHAWTLSRIKYREQYGLELKDRIGILSGEGTAVQSTSVNSSNVSASSRKLLEIAPPSCGHQSCESIFVDCGADNICSATQSNLQAAGRTAETEELFLLQDILCAQNPSCKSRKLSCYSCAYKRSDNLLRDAEKTYVDNIYFIKVPFFGAAFDVNDLGLLGGLSILIVLLMLRLSLRSYIISLRTSRKACITDPEISQPERERFYEVLMSRQVFVFPHFGDREQTYFEGETEKSWNASGLKTLVLVFLLLLRISAGAGIFVLRKVFHRVLLAPSKDDGDAGKKFRNTLTKPVGEKKTPGYYVNPHLPLKSVPKIISLIPGFVYLMVVVNDFLSFEVGKAIDYDRAIFGFFSSAVFLALIWGLGCWCISKWFEVDALWEEFHERVFVKGADSTDLLGPGRNSPLNPS